jgi:hypothetical protein
MPSITRARRLRKSRAEAAHKAEADRLRLFETNKLWMEHHLAASTDGQKYVIDFALLTLRTLSIVNGGALIGMLTFIGNFPAFADAGSPIWWSFILFGGGLAFTLASMLYAYLSQGVMSVMTHRVGYRMYFDTLASGQFTDASFRRQLGNISSNESREEDSERVISSILANHAIAAGISGFAAFCAGVLLAAMVVLRSG